MTSVWDRFDDEPDDDWEPLRTRRLGTMRVVAILVVAAMIIALVVPVLVRLLRDDGDPTEPQDGVRAGVVVVTSTRA